ncbi:MAG: hypothetical protein ACFFEV_10555, partial [Candidatus Thorarchaeota archaeon]
MDSIGTITQYFPFLDEETRTILDGIMIEASDYYDFVQRLCDFVLNNDSPVMVVYFAIHHCMLSFDHKPIDMIREKYGHHQILGPNLYYISAHQGNFEDIKKVHEIADLILATQPEDWIALEMNFMKFEADLRSYPKIMYQTSTVNRIRELIDSDPRFGFYEIVLNDHLAIRSQVDGDTDERLRCIDTGIEYAEKFDDQLRLAHLLIQKGSIYMNFDREKSREVFEKAYSIVENSLEIPSNYARIVYYLSLLDAVRGEFDSAINGCLKAVNILERAGLDSGNPASFLAIFYNVIGEPESGLEWGRMTED